MMDFTSTLGVVAGTLTTICFIPQVTKIWRTKSARDISFAMLAAFCSGLVLWVIYGMLLGEAPIVVANAVTLLLALAILLMKLKYG